MRTEKIAAIVPAAGAGKRMGSEIPKQFLTLIDRPVLAWTLTALENIFWLDHIILSVPADDIQFTENEIIRKYQLTKVKKVIAGGAERIDSVYAGLLQLPVDIPWVLIHDGVRPFIRPELLRTTFAKAQEIGAAILGVPVRDTLKRVNQDIIYRTEDRNQFWLIQTPQFFRRSTLLELYPRALREKLYPTDDATILEHYGQPVAICHGDYYNIKITTLDDLRIAEKLLPLYFSEKSFK